MADLINLKRAKKARERLKKRAEADENAVKFGLAKSERERQASEADKARAALDAHKREKE